MQVTKEPEEHGLALGRTVIDDHGKIRSAAPSTAETSPQAVNDAAPQSAFHELRSNLRAWRHSAAAGVRNVLNIGKEPDVDEVSKAPTLAKPSDVSSTSRLDHKMPQKDKTTIKDFLHHPIDKIKQKSQCMGSHQVVSHIAVNEMSHGQDVDLINAQDKLEHADRDEERLLAKAERDKMIEERQATYIRWTMDRHVTKCRTLPDRAPQWESRSTLEQETEPKQTSIDREAGKIEFHLRQYGRRYIGYGSEPPPLLTTDTIIPILERALIASSPLQTTLMTIRKIYHWEDKVLTSTCLMIFLFLWYYDLFFPGMFLLVICLVVQRRLQRSTIADLRGQVERVEDRDRTAFTLTELIEKEGTELWTDALLERIGPWCMVKLYDAADLLEIMRNFYEWTVPRRTMVSLALIFVAVLVTLFVPFWLVAKGFLLYLGTVFFVLWPLASKYPDYRLLVSTPRRIFWNIPTHGEWALAELQTQGRRHHDRAQPDTKHLEDVDYGSYTAHCTARRGRLVISATSTRFETANGHDVLWKLRYDEMSKLEKVAPSSDKSALSVAPQSSTGLRIASKLGEVHLMESISDRDLAFTQLLGFSNQAWQILW